MPNAPAEVIGRRVAAALIDLLVVALLLVLVGIVFGQAKSGGGSASVSLHGASVSVWALLALGYYFIAEALTGQTLGKRLLRIRVVGASGGAPGPGAVAIRTVLRVIDVLPLFYLVGFVSLLATGRRAQRLGDLVARTSVTAD